MTVDRRSSHGRGAVTQLGERRDQGPSADDSDPGGHGRGGAILPGSLHAGGARGDGAPVAGSKAGGRGSAVPRSVAAHGRVDDDSDAGRALVTPRRGWLPSGTRPNERPGGRLRIAVPAKGRLREPAVALLEDAGLGPESP